MSGPGVHRYPLTGLTCAACAAKVKARLLAHPEITAAEVSVSPQEAVTTGAALLPEAVDKWLAPLGKFRVAGVAAGGVGSQSWLATYRPVLLILVYLLLVPLVLGLASGTFSVMGFMSLMMAGFFIACSYFKLLNLSAIAAAFQRYDLIGATVPVYGFIYPFMELLLGLLYLVVPGSVVLNGFTAVLMAIGLAGVVRAVRSGNKIQCACLGTVFQLPMSTVTIIENAAMIVMALMMLFM